MFLKKHVNFINVQTYNHKLKQDYKVKRAVIIKQTCFGACNDFYSYTYLLLYGSLS